MKPVVNLSPRINKVRTGPDLDLMTIDELDHVELTLRIVTSQIYGIYDPMGLLSPLTIKFKILLQEMHTRKLAWDDPLPPDLDRKARAGLKEIMRAGEIEFPRALVGEVPEGGLERLQLIGFGDGGDPASCAAVYVRSERAEPGPKGETHLVRLVTGKARVTPTSKEKGDVRKSTPRTEMRGGHMLARLVTAILPGLVYKPEEIFLCMDSQCTISSLEAQDKILGTWMTNRANEWQDHMNAWRKQGIKVPEVHHWPGTDNPADLGMRGTAALWEIGPGSRWQDGPESLSFPRKLEGDPGLQKAVT